jgi:TonB family protein
MYTNTWRFFVVACVLLASGVCSASKEDSASAEMLLTQASKLHEVWTAGTPPVVMRAEIQALNAKGALTPGEYIVNWVSPIRWREELRFVNYERLRVHDAKGYWQKSGLNFQPQTIFQIDTVLNSKTVLKIGAKQDLGKVKSHDQDGVRQKCTEVKLQKEIDRILCFDEANGNLLSAEYPKNEDRNPPDISRIEYSAFHDLSEKRVPFEIRAFRDKNVVASIRVLEITAIAEEHPSLFVVPTNSEFWAHCDDMQDPELVGRVQPIYPIKARSSGQSGRVTFYAVIEADGTLTHLTIIRRAPRALESAAADAIRQWHYKPAVCGSTPVRVETSISVDFYLQSPPF